MPCLLRFVLRQAAIGWGAAAVFVGALVLTDPGGIGRLLTQPQEGPGPLLLLWGFTGLTFCGAQMALALTSLEAQDNQGARSTPSGGGGVRSQPLRPTLPGPGVPKPLPVRPRRPR
jgi:hypothetical protein